MVQQSHTATADDIAGNFAATLPPYDPDERRRDGSRWVILASLVLHLGLLWYFWGALFGVIVEEERVVTVRMVEEERPEPEKARPKVLAQRMLDTSVRRFKNVVQPEVRVVKPVQVLDRATKVEVERIQVTEAPKKIVTKHTEIKKLSTFAEVATPIQPIKIDNVSPTVKQVEASRASSGPRKLDAAGPIVNAQAADIEAPVLTKGVLSNTTVDGDTRGAKIASLESGASDRMVRGDGNQGLVPGGIAKDCHKDPVCLAYLKMIRDRVYARWHPPDAAGGGTVKLRFRVDRGGSAHRIQLVSADGKLLGETCLQAFRHASPFPPPPKEIHYITDKGLTGRFLFGQGE